MKHVFLILYALAFTILISSCECGIFGDECDSCDKSSISADFNINSSGIIGTPINFTDACSGDTDGITYLWNFGDNTTSTEKNPIHIYSEPGQYNISLSVKNSCGKLSDVIKTIYIVSIPTSKVLQVHHVTQQTMVWCWAACSEMVLNYYYHYITQCQILSAWYSFDCCSYPYYCQTTGTLQQITTNLQYFGGLKSTIKNSPLTLSEIAYEIANNRPIIIAYTNYQSGHVVVIFGYDLSTQNIYIYDPNYPNTAMFDYSLIVPYSTTFTYSGTMQWTNSIYQIRY